MSDFSQLPLESFYTDFFAPLFLRNRSDDTRRLYLTTLRNFGKFLGRRPLLSDLNDDSVNRFLDWFRRLPRSPFTVNKERSNLLAIWRFACRKRMLDIWPDVEADTQPERIPQAWTQDEIFRLFAACRAEPGYVAGVLACDWWTALHLVAWDSSERIGAIRPLCWQHFDLAGGWMLAPAELRKGGRSDRLYALSGDTIIALRAILLPARQEVWPWPYCRTYLWRKYETILTRAGLPTDRKSKFHRVRKSAASHFQAAGGDASKLLGHADPRMIRAYIDPRICPEEQAKDRLFRPDGPDRAA